MITAELAALRVLRQIRPVSQREYFSAFRQIRPDYERWEKFRTKNKKLVDKIGEQILERASQGYYNVETTVDIQSGTYYALCGYLRDAKGYSVKSDRKMTGPHTLVISWEKGDK